MKRIFCTLFMLLSIIFDTLKSQCTPPEAWICDEANVLCSLDELSGYSCQNNSPNAGGCTPLCSQGGVPHNTGWWAFVCDGGDVSVTMTVLSCVTDQGIQFGIWGDCNCTEEVSCQSIPCIGSGSVTITANLVPCKLYYLWVDGCSGDVCDFVITTSGGTTPPFFPINPINNDTDRIIEPVCKGYCGYRFFVNPQPGGCELFYVWELDGVEVSRKQENVTLDFPDEGDFNLCVTAFIGNLKSGSMCSQDGPVCAKIKVRQKADRIGIPRTICKEQIPFVWHGQLINTSGEYRHPLMDTIGCCEFDSVVEFTVIDSKLPITVLGQNEFCTNQSWIAWYVASPIYRYRINYHWNVPDGSILWKTDSSVLIEWNSAGRAQRNLHFVYTTECGDSNFASQIIYFNQTFAGYDDKIVGLHYPLKANAYSSGNWTKITGPGNAQFENEKIPLSKVRVTKYGKYVFRWTNLCPNGFLFDEVTIEFTRFNTTPGETNDDNFGTIVREKLFEERSNVNNNQNVDFIKNPSDGISLFLQFAASSMIMDVKIIDLEGRVRQHHLIQDNISNKMLSLDPHLPNGLFIVLIQTQTGMITKKLVVTR